MANSARRLETNAPGDFFVDDACIDCGTCRWMAPSVFDRSGSRSRVHLQPVTPDAVRQALRALVACPVAAIGTHDVHDVAAVAREFPVEVSPGVYHCGYHSPDSYGAASYLIARREGNILVDSPRFAGPLVTRIAALGGIRLMFLSHQDDVADHARFAERFGCDRIIHTGDLSASLRDVEIRLEGQEQRVIAPGVVAIPTPGHTPGSACLLVDDTFLFTGDHLAWSIPMQRLTATPMWGYDWATQIESMRKLSGYRFEHVLPGHGAPCRMGADAMVAEVLRCVGWMRTAA